MPVSSLMIFHARPGALIVAALCVQLPGCGSQAGPEPVVSAGGNVVEGQLLDEILAARRSVPVFRRPERHLLFPMFWKEPVPAGHVESGDAVRVVAVAETYLWRDRLVWLELQPLGGASAETLWFRIGHQLFASSAVWRHWAKLPPLLAAAEELTPGVP